MDEMDLTLKKLEELDAQKDALIYELMNACHWALNIEGIAMLDTENSFNAQAHFDVIREKLNLAISAGYEVR